MAQATDDPADPDQTEIVNLAAVEQAKDPQGDQNVLRPDLNLRKVKKNVPMQHNNVYMHVLMVFVWLGVCVHMCYQQNDIIKGFFPGTFPMFMPV